jgi:hypothetical protein
MEELMKLKHKIGLVIVILFIIIPLIYLVYDQLIMPPMLKYPLPPYVPSETWNNMPLDFSKPAGM